MKKWLIRIAGIGLLVAALCVIIGTFIDGDVESTDDAQVEQRVMPINVKVTGYVREVRFTEHQHVSKGDTLLIIDDRELAISLRQAEAALMDAQGGRKVMGNTVNTATTSATVYDASIEEGSLRVSKLETDYRRYSNLLEKKATTPAVVEQYKTELDMARARVEALRKQREAARSTVSEATQRQENTAASIQRAEAAVDMARLNLSYTVITAPCDGIIGRRALEEGQLVGAGQTMTTIVPDTRRWVVANFKETQLSRIRTGQRVEISIDAIPGKRFCGQVTAISAATGSKYSALPTDNSAGNFVKIQQRVPVRIDFDQSLSREDNMRMASGMMCEVKVKTKKIESEK